MTNDPAQLAIRKHYNASKVQLRSSILEPMVSTIRGRAPGCRLLVFGVGHDTDFWRSVNVDGETVFLESDPFWSRTTRLRSPGARIVPVDYGDWTVAGSLPIDADVLAAYPMPEVMRDGEWDVVVIDAPPGFLEKNPGRALPIYWTSQVMTRRTHIFVDDHEREVETRYAETFLTEPGGAARCCVLKGDKDKTTFWRRGISPGFGGITCTTKAKTEPIRYVLNTPELSLLWFHDSIGVLGDLPRLGLFGPRAHVIYSFSWYQGRSNFEAIARKVDALAGTVEVDPWDHLTFLLNSAEEVENARGLIPDRVVELANNAALVDTGRFDIRPVEQHYDAILNSKALAFKRHHLSAGVESKAFLTYGVSEPDKGYRAQVDIAALDPAHIFRNLPPDKVCDALNSARIGLILSEEEGACYASLEYLLCGLPVVSTPSRGGRDEYYTEANARVCDPTPEAVAAAVDDLAGRLRDGSLRREDVRASALDKVQEFRGVIAARLQRIAGRHGLEVDGAALLEDLARDNNKLRDNRNFWVLSVQPG